MPAHGALLAPLEHLLASGGDTRLAIDPVDRLNSYGCRPFPRPEAFTFASSTATSISERAYRRADRARQELIGEAAACGFSDASARGVARTRRELARLLALERVGADVILSPSGTDSQLLAVFAAQSLLGTPLTSVIVACDETGSGTALSARGRHFGTLTAQATAVEKGSPVAGLSGLTRSIGIPSRAGNGRPYAAAEMDAMVIDAIMKAVREGDKVLLLGMDASKFGRRSPSDACLLEIRERWPDVVQVAIDACQFRLGRRRLRWYLDLGFMVLVTGSKFFTGPPFSGALLIPRDASRRLSGADDVPAGLRDYTNASDWPEHWSGFRSRLPARVNIGQWLRWEAALEEMNAYFAVPASFRIAALEQFAAATPRLIAHSETLALLPDAMPHSCGGGKMALRTIFPFIVRRDGQALSSDACLAIYRALNRDVAGILPDDAPARERRIAAQPCHIGQPVTLHESAGVRTSALRISAGARFVSESWSPDEDAAAANIGREIEQVAMIVEKIDLLVRYFEALAEPGRMSSDPFQPDRLGRLA
jgi:hypothetical protein